MYIFVLGFTQAEFQQKHLNTLNGDMTKTPKVCMVLYIKYIDTYVDDFITIITCLYNCNGLCTQKCDA